MKVFSFGNSRAVVSPQSLVLVCTAAEYAPQIIKDL